MEKRHPSTLRLISGIANLKTQGILQIDWKESKSVLFKTKQGLYAPSTLCKAEDKEAKVKWVWECLGPTVSLFTFNKNTKNVTKKRMPHIRRCETVKIEITKLF